MYPQAKCALLHRNPWELLVATILSAQCTDKRVNEVTPGLFAKYPTPQDFAAVQPEVLAQDIRSTGFFNNKAKSIVGAAKKITAEFGGKVPRTIEEMRLRRTVAVNEGLYSQLRSRYAEAKLAEASASPDVNVLDSAAVPLKPSKNTKPSPNRLPHRASLVVESIEGDPRH